MAITRFGKGPVLSMTKSSARQQQGQISIRVRTGIPHTAAKEHNRFVEKRFTAGCLGPLKIIQEASKLSGMESLDNG